MLFFAVARRVSDYGITENRYFLFIISFWLFSISLYFIISKIKNIKIIPVSLCIITFLTSFGPWGAFSISQNSQLKRLEILLIENKILINGIIEKNHLEISNTDNQEISSIVTYLNSRAQLYKTNKWFKNDLKLGKNYENPKIVVEAMGLIYSPYWSQNSPGSGSYIYFNSAYTKESTDISGYNRFVKINFNDNIVPYSFNIHKKEYRFTNNRDKLSLTLASKKEKIIEIDLKPFVNNLIRKYHRNSYQVPFQEMTLESKNEKIKLKIIFNSLQGEKIGNTVKLKYITAEMYLNIKENQEK